MGSRLPRNFTMAKAAVLAVLIAATQIMPMGATTPGDSLHKASSWQAAMEYLDCPISGDQPTV